MNGEAPGATKFRAASADPRHGQRRRHELTEISRVENTSRTDRQLPCHVRLYPEADPARVLRSQLAIGFTRSAHPDRRPQL